MGRYNRLVGLVEEEAEGNFRSAFRYDDSGWQALYIRPELATGDLEQVVPKLAERVRSREPVVREADYPILGAERASISLHEEAVLVHIREGPEAGVVLTLDTDVAKNLSEFVARCERVLRD